MKTYRVLFVILFVAWFAAACTVSGEVTVDRGLTPSVGSGTPVSAAPSATPAATATGQPTQPTPAATATGQPTQPTPAPTRPPASPVPPTTAPAAGPTLSAGSVNPKSGGLSTLGTFRQRMTVNFKDASTGLAGTYHYQADVNTAQPAMYIVVTAEGAGMQYLPANKIEAIWIGDKLWVKVGNQPWILVPEAVAAAQFEEQVFTAGGFIPYVPGAKQVTPDETINGILCHHYTYSVQNAKTQYGTVSGSGDIYTAVQGGYVIRFTLNGTGTFQEGGQTVSGTLGVVYDTYDVGADINIQPPKRF